jgi:hypothetical protein
MNGQGPYGSWMRRLGFAALVMALPAAVRRTPAAPVASALHAAHAVPPPTIRNPSTRTCRCAIGAAAVIPALLIGVLGNTHTGAPQDSGLVACAYPLSTQDVPAAGYPKIRAQFAGSRWPDLRTAGTAYVDLAIALRTARGTDGYETVWFYQRLSAACAKHGRPLPS